MKHKVGNIVTVRSDLEVHERYGGDYFTANMEKFKGKKVSIDRVGQYIYKIAEDGGSRNWTDEMFEDHTIIINKWDDLHKVKNDRYEIIASNTRINIFELSNDRFRVSSIIIKDKNLILKWLTLFGFDVEFKKKPTLTTIEMEIVKGLIALDFYFLVNLGGCIYAKNNNQPDLFISINMFKFIRNSESFSLAYLVLLEVQNDNNDWIKARSKN